MPLLLGATRPSQLWHPHLQEAWDARWLGRHNSPLLLAQELGQVGPTLFKKEHPQCWQSLALYVLLHCSQLNMLAQRWGFLAGLDCPSQLLEVEYHSLYRITVPHTNIQSL